MRYLVLILAAVFGVAFGVLASAAEPTDPLADYYAAPKHFDTYPNGSFKALVARCYANTGNLPACVCALWSLEEAMTYDEAKALPDGPGAALDVLYEACEMKHPAPFPPDTTAEL